MSERSYEAVEQQGKQSKWRLTIGPDSFRLDSPEGGRTIEVTRPERTERTDLMHGWFLKRILAVTTGKEKKLFKVDPEGFAALRDWAGAPTTADLRKALRQRFGLALTLGILIIFTSLPTAGVPEKGLAPLPLNPVSLAMGIALIAAGFMSRIMPSRIFFLFDAVWIIVAAWSTITFLVDAPGFFNLLILFLQANYIATSVREYRRFATMTSDDASAPPQESGLRALRTPLVLGLVLGGIWWTTLRPTPPADLDEAMGLAAAGATAMAKEAFGTDLDGSVESLRKVDEILGKLGAGKRGDVDGENASLFGAYIGEAIRKAHPDARWEGAPDGAALHWKGGLVFPHDWAAKRLQNGEEDSVWAKYSVLKAAAAPRKD
jgi:hypothetical protein